MKLEPTLPTLGNKEVGFLWWCSNTHKRKKGDPYPTALQPDETCEGITTKDDDETLA